MRKYYNIIHIFIDVNVSQPMLIGDVNMTTIGHWTGGTMDHEWLFWDNQAFMKQIGLAS
jgi:hypothetical protein